MLRQKTLLILGAGSSKDFGFPLGPELTDRIADAVSFDFSEFRPTGGHETIRARLHTLRYHQPPLHNEWIAACEYIRRNIHLSSSVDRFIDSNRDNDVVVGICKFAIALLIADCESQSCYAKREYELSNFDSRTVKERWTTKLFHWLHTNIASKEIDCIFDQIRVVTFNYDRIFEQALATAIANFYSVSMQQAIEAVSKLGTVHVYGSLGPLSPSETGHRPFGSFGDNPEAAQAQIRTYHESVSSELAAKITEFIDWCERVFVLGFSYATMNTDFLYQCAKDLKQIRPIYATCFKMSEPNRDVARRSMEGIFAQHNSSARMLDVTCERFFDDLALTV